MRKPNATSSHSKDPLAPEMDIASAADKMRASHIKGADQRTHSLGFIVGTLGRRIAWNLTRHTAAHGVMPGAFPILRCLRDLSVSTQAELSRIIGVEQPSMALTLNRMERDGLIERRADAEDARRRLVTLTRHGKEMLAVMTDAAQSVYAIASDGLTQKEIQEFLRIGLKMVENLERER
jgi:MarR family transcriptional regulator for hemolysin